MGGSKVYLLDPTLLLPILTPQIPTPLIQIPTLLGGEKQNVLPILVLVLPVPVLVLVLVPLEIEHALPAPDDLPIQISRMMVHPHHHQMNDMAQKLCFLLLEKKLRFPDALFFAKDLKSALQI